MILCSRCNSRMLEGALFCEECGFNLHSYAMRQASTTQIDTVVDVDNVSVRSGWGTATFAATHQMVLYIRDVEEPVVIEPLDGLVIGRADAESGTKPDLDLGAYGGLEKGVSRRHAAILRGDDVLSIVDTGSANGTYLNGVRLTANQPRILRDGDEIRFGNLTVYVYFQ